MKGYQQLSRDERLTIEYMLEERASLRRIARRLGRAPSTLSRELKRNRCTSGGYCAESARQRAAGRPRGRPPCRIRPPTLAEPHGSAAWRSVLQHLLDEHWSPQLIAGRLRLLQPADYVSRETIYRFIYHPRQHGQRLWLHLAEQRRSRRRRSARAKLRSQWRRGPGLERRPPSAIGKAICCASASPAP